MSAHGYDTKRFPLTPAQGRVLYHAERLFRSTGAGMREHAQYLAAVRAHGLDPVRVADWTQEQCVQGLQLMEAAAAPMRLFRDVRTGWRDFVRVRPYGAGLHENCLTAARTDSAQYATRR